MFSQVKSNEAGFSYLEVLITIMLLAVFFLPIMKMLSASVAHLSYVGDMNTALGLAREGMERVRNLRISQAQLIARGDEYEPPLPEEPLVLNGSRWRVLRDIHEGTRPLEVHVLVFKDEVLDEPLVEVKTLIEELS